MTKLATIYSREKFSFDMAVEQIVSVIWWNLLERLFHAADSAERKPWSPNLVLVHSFSNAVVQCFSTQVPRNLRFPPAVSKGSAGPPVLSKFAATRRIF